MTSWRNNPGHPDERGTGREQGLPGGGFEPQGSDFDTDFSSVFDEELVRPEPAAAPRPANLRDARHFARARRHSLAVRMLKFALPVAAIVLTGGFIGMTALSSAFTDVANFSIKGAGLEDGKLIMNQPKMNGFDKHNQPYDVVAKKAVQDLKKPGVIVLDSIDATVPVGKGKFANVDAHSGVYNTETERLVLKEDVKVKGMSGFDIDLQQADIDMKTGSMTTNKPVEVRSKDAQINADSMQVENNGKRIVFKNRVQMTIDRSNAQTTPSN